MPAFNERKRHNLARYRAEERPWTLTRQTYARDRTPMSHLNASEIGAWAEMVAASDLLRRGYQVFRAVSPSAPCDFVVVIENRCCRVEVKTAHRKKRGGLMFAQKDFDASKHDVLALVTPDGHVTYIPEWPRPS